jgi:hypothetical protein
MLSSLEKPPEMDKNDGTLLFVCLLGRQVCCYFTHFSSMGIKAAARAIFIFLRLEVKETQIDPKCVSD